MKKILIRVNSPTPKFFRRLRTLGLSLAAAGGAIMAAPIILPTIIITIGGYILTAGTVITAVSQITTVNDDLKPTSK